MKNGRRNTREDAGARQTHLLGPYASASATTTTTTQSISDGYRATKPKKTVLVLLDYSKAFDRVWKDDLIIRAIDKGLPISYAQWLRDFLSNKKAKVQINGDRGRQLPLRQGLPQGSVLSPLLFLLYIDDHRRAITQKVEVAMFAEIGTAHVRTTLTRILATLISFADNV